LFAETTSLWLNAVHPLKMWNTVEGFVHFALAVFPKAALADTFNSPVQARSPNFLNTRRKPACLHQTGLKYFYPDQGSSARFP
jgi:hypothetical protein